MWLFIFSGWFLRISIWIEHDWRAVFSYWLVSSSKTKTIVLLLPSVARSLFLLHFCWCDNFQTLFEDHDIDVFLPFWEGVEIKIWFDEWWGHRGYTIIRHPCRLPSKCVVPFWEGVEIKIWFDEWWGHRGYTIIRHPCRLPSKCVVP